jgi:hypothetical protein
LATTTLSRALADCMECLREGESVEACLRRYPQQREKLRPLLELAQALRDHQPEVAPSPYFLTDLKSKLITGKLEGGEVHRNRR